MSLLQGFPARGSDITLLITKVHLHPLCELVEFWGKFCQERKADYASWAKDIQSAGMIFQEFEGKHGDQCLVQIGGTWYRCRIVSRNDNKYSVFLIDSGMTHSTTTANLAWGKKEYFQLPPEVEYCVLANTLPLSNDNRWSPRALEFLKYLPGKSVDAHVQDILVAQRTFLLDIPSISKQMCELGLARTLSPEMFQDFVLMTLQSQSNALVFPKAEKVSSGVSENLHQRDTFLYPEISAGTVETVVVTHVINPHRLFCQLKVFSKELQKLSNHLSLFCEGRTSRCSVTPEMIGFPCATRKSDGKWCRSVLQQVFPNGNVVEVLNVDCGSKRCVQVENVRPLAAEFFRMPVVTYICSLYGIADSCTGWTSNQIEYLKRLLLHKTVIARFEYQNIFEGVYFVTLHGEENESLNNVFGSMKSCFLEDKASQIRQCDHGQQPQQDRNETTKVAVTEREMKQMVEKLPCEDLPVNSFCTATVQHVFDPSEFWIQTYNYANELDELMEHLNRLYEVSLSRHLVSNPAVGLYCAAKAEDGNFYRARVVRIVDEKQIQVFFVDYGNTEVVSRSNIRSLPKDFKMLPCLALKCTLAGVRPKDGEWSQRGCEYFSHAVIDATVSVHVAAKYNEDLVVCVTLEKAAGESDVGALMCMAGFAEKAEMPGPATLRMTEFCAILAQPDSRTPHVDSSHQMLIQSLNAAPPTSKEGVIAFKMSAFPVGSVLDVTVAFIESPSYFCCQLVQHSRELKLLMHNIQDCYKDSEFQPVADTACVARHPENGKWYRALRVGHYGTAHVKVLFVDYGQTKTVSLCDLRDIHPEFLTLPSQAFRCNLLNPLDSLSVATVWNKEAIAKFQGFVETAASDFVILKCIIYAIMHNEENDVFNIVDLETPFESLSSSMVSMFKSAPSKKFAGTSFSLDTYFFSTHNIKVGTEEQMTVTCVNSVGQFFCHPSRNADVIIKLKVKLNRLCQQLDNRNCPAVLGMLCFARYTDGQWYRGQIKATKPAVLVHFVDYGDTIEVEKYDLLPVPKRVNDIMSVPVQAVVCSLSDVPVSVPQKVNRWFQSNVTECTFRALIVARESDGTLMVELYHDKTQINAELKKIFQIEAHADEHVLHQGRQAAATITETRGQSQLGKAIPHIQVTNMNLDADLKPVHLCENSRKVKPAPLKLYQPPPQRSPDNPGKGLKSAGPSAGPEDGLLTETSPFESKSHEPKKDVVEKLPKLEELPSRCVPSGLEVDVYVSHCNSPLSFYVQLVREEEELISMVEELNDPVSAPPADVIQVHPGDLIQAEFAEDSSWYRAVVKETSSETAAVVEFVDFGNTATTLMSKIGVLDKHFLQRPVFSIHCLLHGATEETLGPEAVQAFTEKMRRNAEKVLKCTFLRQCGSMWEVSFKDSSLDKLCKSSPSPTEADISGASENLLKCRPDSSSLHYSQPDFAVGQTMQVRVSTVNDNHTFWCLPADSDYLTKITSTVADVCHGPRSKCVDPEVVCAGSPCAALFSGDGLWHRAEVAGKDGDKLSVFFVDQGATSTVSIADVRELSCGLVETPPLAFLCELEGFDTSCGSWDSDVTSKLLELITDTILQITVTGVTRDRGKIKCFVCMETGGQVLNEALKQKWKSLTSDPAAEGPSPEHKTRPQADSALKESPQAEDPREHLQGENSLSAQRDGKEAEIHGELHQSETEHPAPTSCQTPGEHLMESPEEDRGPESKIAKEPREVLAGEVVSRSRSVAETEDVQSADDKDQILSLTYNKDDQSSESSCDQRSPEHCEEDLLAPSTRGQDDLNVPLEEALREHAGNSELHLICLHGDDNCSCFDTSVDNERFSGK